MGGYGQQNQKRNTVMMQLLEITPNEAKLKKIKIIITHKKDKKHTQRKLNYAALE